MPKEFSGPSLEEMGIQKTPIGSPESDLQFVLDKDGKPTDVIQPKPGRELPKPPELAEPV